MTPITQEEEQRGLLVSPWFYYGGLCSLCVGCFLLGGDAMNLSDYLMTFRDEEGLGLPEGEDGYKSSFPLAKRIVCRDGFSLSVQATHGAYCSPRQNVGPWYEVEVGFPSAPPEIIMHHAEQPEIPTETVYAYVPIEEVEALIALHGGSEQLA